MTITTGLRSLWPATRLRPSFDDNVVLDGIDLALLR